MRSIALLLPLVACESSPPEPLPAKAEPPPAVTPATPAAASARPATGTTAASAAPAIPASTAEPAAASAAPKAPPAQSRAPVTAAVPISAGDPAAGKFTLAEATKGLTGKGPLLAEIVTARGTLTCTLYDDRAPVTVANFVGLARGLRPFKAPDGQWVKRPAYDGTTFHRVVPGFMIQGGDPKGDGSGEPGYVIPDEIWQGARHDRAGLLCMANRGKNTNGQQFFVTDAAAPHLDGGYTIFGECEPTKLVSEIAAVERRGDRAVDPVKITRIVVKRGKAKAAK